MGCGGVPTRRVRVDQRPVLPMKRGVSVGTWKGRGEAEVARGRSKKRSDDRRG